MLEKIIEIAKPYCSEDLDWNEDISIMSDMELSSLDFFAFISTVEEYFNIRISERQLKRIDTLGDLMEVIKAQK